MHPFTRRLSSCVLALAASSPLLAYDPVLNLIMPRGGTRGQEMTLHFRGDRMFEPQELLLYQKGISVKSLKKENPKYVKATIVIAPDAPLGEHPVRLRCAGGVSYMRTFWVGQFPVTDEKEPNNQFSQPQAIEMNQTIHGSADTEDIDYYRVHARKGQRISAEVEGMRLGSIFFDPYLAILDSRRFELATSDDTALLKQDPFVSIVAPKDGEYTIMVRESAYEGNKQCRYRLHVGHFSRPKAVYPPAALPGKEAHLTFIGDPTGHYTLRHPIPADAAHHNSQLPFHAEKDGLLAPSPNPVLISSLPFVNETEPNNGWNKLKQASTPSAPCAFHGIIKQPGDRDTFKFRAQKGQNLRIRTQSRALRSPLDSVLSLRDSKGKSIRSNDDQGGPDSVIDFKAPADGEYFIQIRDHLGQGGPSYTYRIEIDRKHPQLSASLPVVKRNDSQMRKVICVPRGNRYATVVNIKRENLSCECLFEAPDLPEGIQMQSYKAGKSDNNFLALFEARPDAPIAGGLYRLSIRDAKPGSPHHGPLREIINHIEINNTGVFHSTVDEQVAIAVIEEAPFLLELHTPPVPIVRHGTTPLKITVRRKDGFDAPITITLPWKPTGLGAPTSITIPKGQNEGVYHLNASGDAALGTYHLCVSATTKTAKGTVMISSALVPLKISEPLLSASLEMASTTPGTPVSLLCKIEHLQPIDGQAEIQLHGLPHGVKAAPKQIDAQTKEVVFDLEVAKDAAKGNHNALFCRILPKRNGHAIPHQSGQGGSLRINPPPPVKKAPAQKKPAAKTAPTKKVTPAKPLSRLEQLRQRSQN